MTQPKWMEILKQEVARSNVTQVAKKLGYARTSVSLALNDKYIGKTDRLEAAVLETFSGKISCPHLKQEIGPSACKDFREKPMPMSDPQALRHWTACQSCAFNQKRERRCEDA